MKLINYTMIKEKPIHRVRNIIDFLKTNISTFENEINVNNGSIQAALKRESRLKDDTLNAILDRYDFISPVWLLTGEGTMSIKGDAANERKKLDLTSSDQINVEEISKLVVGNQDLFLEDMLFREFVEKIAHRKMLEIYKKNETI